MAKNTKKLKKALKLIDQIQKIRSKNNKNWMDLLRLSVALDYKTKDLLVSCEVSVSVVFVKMLELAPRQVSK